MAEAKDSVEALLRQAVDGAARELDVLESLLTRARDALPGNVAKATVGLLDTAIERVAAGKLCLSIEPHSDPLLRRCVRTATRYGRHATIAVVLALTNGAVEPLGANADLPGLIEAQLVKANCSLDEVDMRVAELERTDPDQDSEDAEMEFALTVMRFVDEADSLSHDLDRKLSELRRLAEKLDWKGPPEEGRKRATVQVEVENVLRSIDLTELDRGSVRRDIENGLRGFGLRTEPNLDDQPSLFDLFEDAD